VSLTINAYADVACPWCYIGRARLQTVLDRRLDLVVQIRWHPFSLRPDLPPDGRDWRAFADEKFGSWERAQPMFERVREAGSKRA